ncbi:DUF4189 domain-containing protein [Lysobacter brunescens]
MPHDAVMKPFVRAPYSSIHFVVASFLFLYAGTALAQAYPCPQGPGAGQQQVGTAGGSNGVASVPMCVDTGAGSAGYSASQSGPAPIHAAHWVLAIGTRSDGRAAYMLAADAVFAEDAEARVFRRCEAAAIRDCRVVRKFDRGLFALAEAADGGFVHAIYPYPQFTSEIRQAKKALKEAEKAIAEACVQQTGAGCTVKEVRPSNEWTGYDE